MNLEDYADWHAAYRHFDERLFAGVMPEVVFALHQRRSARGYAARDRYLERETGQKLHELAMNPDDFLERTDRETLSTFVHEMCHVWQYAFGEAKRTTYHNEEWAARMEAIGLMPSHDGRPGGKRTGYHVSHYTSRTNW
jgi:predicted SprT family Zn-dependent metalloprotease